MKKSSDYREAKNRSTEVINIKGGGLEMKKVFKFLSILVLSVSLLFSFSNVLLPSSFSKSAGSFTLKAQGGCGFIGLEWDKVEGASSYYIYRGVGEGNEASMPLTDFPIAENIYKDTNDLIKGTKYCYYVTALDKDNKEIGRSNEACAAPTCSSGEEDECTLTLRYQIGNQYYWVNGVKKDPTTAPMLKWDRTFLVIRYVVEEVNGQIFWDSTTKTVTIITKEGKKIEFIIGNNKYKVDGLTKQIDPNNSKVVPFIDGGRTYIPLRVTGEELGASEINWYTDTKIAELIFKVPCPQKPKGGITALVQCPNLAAMTPIPGATINIYDSNNALVWTGVTDSNGTVDTGLTLPPGQYRVVPSANAELVCTKELHIATVVSGQETNVKINCCKIETKTICACLVRMTIQPDSNGNYQVYVKENCKEGDPVYDLVLNFPATLLDSNLGINVLSYYNQFAHPIPSGLGCISVKYNPLGNSVVQWWAYPDHKPCCSCCVTPPSGMVAWWPLDETSGTTAHDIAGYPNNGTCVNCPTPVSGKVDGALYFVQNHYIEVPPQTELDFGTGNFSIDAWIKSVQCKDGILSPIVDKLDVSSNTGFFFYLDQHPAGTVFLKLNINGSTFTSTSSFQANTWTHVAVTINRTPGSNAVGTFYINGIPSGIFTPVNSTVTNNLPLWIGETRVTGGRCETTLDEIELFNRVLSPDEIKGIYNAGSCGKCKPTTGQICITKFNDLNGNGKPDQNEPLLSGWVFNVTDQNGNLIGTITTNPPVVAAACLKMPAPGTYTVTEQVQPGWTPTTPNPQTVTVSPGQTLNLTFGNHYESSGRIVVSMPKECLDGTTVHIYDSTSGVEVWHSSTPNYDAATGMYSFDTGCTLKCPATYKVVPTNEKCKFYPESQEVTIKCCSDYTTVNFKCECSNCVEPPSGMVAWWPLDETQAPIANDLAGVNNAGTWVNSPVPVTGMVSGALNFNGKNSVDVADHSELNFGKGNFSIDLWIKTSDTNQSVRTILDKRTGTSTNPTGYELYLYKSRIGLQIADGTSTNYNSSDSSSIIIADNNWHHVAVTVDRATTSGLHFYVDGSLVATFNPTTRQGDLTNTAPFVIGRNLISSEQIFIGTLDEIELFNRVLSPDEIKGIYNAKADGKCKPKIVVKDASVDVYLLSAGKEFKIGTYKTDFTGTFKFDYPLDVKIPQNPIFKFVVNADPNIYPSNDNTCYVQFTLAPPGKGLEIKVFYIQPNSIKTNKGAFAVNPKAQS